MVSMQYNRRRTEDPTSPCFRVAISILFIWATWIIIGVGASISVHEAECKLAITGTGARGSPKVLLHCTPEQPPVRVGASKEFDAAAANLRGVQIDHQMDCMLEAMKPKDPGSLIVSARALLFFCGNYHLRFPDLTISGVNMGIGDELSRTPVIFISGNARAAFSNSTMQGNTASSVLRVLGPAHVTFIGANMSRNVGWEGAGVVAAGTGSHVEIRDSFFAGNKVAWDGGALLSFLNASILIHNSTFVHNAALNDSGGAVVVSDAHVEIHNSSFDGNKGAWNGGAISSDSNASTLIYNSTFVRNAAQNGSGGAVVVSDAHVEIHDSYFGSNKVLWDGGALFSDLNASILVHNSTFIRNAAPNGSGGALAASGSSLTLVNSTFTNNIASDPEDGGGAVAAGHQSNLSITRNTFVDNTAACEGGAVYLYDESHANIDHTSFSGNVAGEIGDSHCGGGGALCLSYQSSLSMHDCAITDNMATQGGGISMFESSVCRVAQTSFRNNTAYLPLRGQIQAREQSGIAPGDMLFGMGGAISVQQPGTLYLSHSKLLSNTAWGDGGAIEAAAATGATAFGNITIENVSVVNNYAYNGGGGLSLSSTNLTLVDCVIENNNATVGGGVYLDMGSNMTMRGQGTSNTTSALRGNSALFGGGIYADPTEDFQGGSDQAHLSFTNTAITNNEISNANSDIVCGPAFDLHLFNSTISYSSPTVECNRKVCRVGEYQGPSGYCQKCPALQYSLWLPDPNVANSSNNPCKPCNSSAYCPGGAIIVSKSGYWQGTSASCLNCTLDYIMRCPNPKACEHPLKTLASQDPYSGSMLSNYTMQQCNGSLGYTGLLCGSCKEGFGSTGPFTCQPCLGFDGRGQVKTTGIIVLMVVYCFVFVAIVMVTSWTSLVSNEDQINGDAGTDDQTEMMHIIKALVIYSAYIKTIAKLPLAWLTDQHVVQHVGQAADTVSQMRVAGVEIMGWVSGVAFGSAVSLDCVLVAATLGGLSAPVRVAIKGFINLFAPVVILALAMLLRVGWWFLRGWVSGLMLSAASICYMPFAPTRLFLHRLHLKYLRNEHGVQYLRSYFLVTLLVTVFFWYPTWVRVAMGSLACVCVCPYQAKTGGRMVCPAECNYWVQDMTVTCPKAAGGAALGWALAVAIPAWVLSAIVPIGVVGLLWWATNKQTIQQEWFVRKFGFLYNDYRVAEHTAFAATSDPTESDRVLPVGAKLRMLYHKLSRGSKRRLVICWNAVIHVQTLIVTFISVYGVLLHEYYQVLILTFALGLYLIMVTWLRPFKSAPIQRLQSLSLAVLSFTSLATFTFIEPANLDERQENYYNQSKEIMLWVVLVVNILFLLVAVLLLGSNLS